jgi:Zn-dependent M28 family amino/carboxypeptidase
MDPFEFRGQTFHNVVAGLDGSEPAAPRVLIGAHYDSVPFSPGADDNASGVAALLECARLLRSDEPRATIDFVAFNLEEQQTTTYRVGSRRHARRARKAGLRYSGALIFEMVGYRDTTPGSQSVPKLIAWKKIPRTGDFLAVTGDGRSRPLLRSFVAAARESVPELPVVPLVSPLRGWLVWQTRLSDNASFWSEGYPALMITDTAFLRNPHYHRPTDRADTLDFAFMAQVVDATVAAARLLAR